MKKLLLSFLIVCSFSCRTMDYTLWRYSDVDVKESNSKKLKLNGYYLHDGFKENGLYFGLSPEIVLLRHGNAILTYSFSREEKAQNNKNWVGSIGNYTRTEWPRYSISGDSLVIQYFYNTETPGWLIGWNEFTVMEIRCRILNDSTFVVPHIKYNSASDFYGGKGIQNKYFSPPQVYHFVRSDTLPPFENWIKSGKIDDPNQK